MHSDLLYHILLKNISYSLKKSQKSLQKFDNCKLRIILKLYLSLIVLT